MRLTDADWVGENHTKFMAQFTDTEPTYEDLYTNLVGSLNNAPTVDAIPVEQVARMLANYTNDFPCDYAEGYAKSQKDGFCELEQCGCDDNYTCWLHALQEGWLDDGTDET